MIEIDAKIKIPESELKMEFVRASGPGGQNVNKVATAVQLRFDVANSVALPVDIKERLGKIAGRKLTEEGILIIEARRFRSQERNRNDAIERLMALIRKAQVRPKSRQKTKPPPKVNERRLEEKKRRSRLKESRKSPDA